VVLVTVPCHQVLESGVSDIPVVINDDRRVRWLNDVQVRYAAAHAPAVVLADLYGYLCSGGYTDQLGGVDPLHTDGLHFTEEGVQMVWRWLAPQLVQVSRGAGLAGASPSAESAGRTAPGSSAPPAAALP
jgi:hypothetical protein